MTDSEPKPEIPRLGRQQAETFLDGLVAQAHAFTTYENVEKIKKAVDGLARRGCDYINAKDYMAHYDGLMAELESTH